MLLEYVYYFNFQLLKKQHRISVQLFIRMYVLMKLRLVYAV